MSFDDGAITSNGTGTLTASVGAFTSLSIGQRANLPATSVATAGGTTTLTATSAPVYIFTGTATQNCNLPNATTLPVGWDETVMNASTSAITIRNNGGTTLYTIPRGNSIKLYCTNTGSANGTWQALGANYTQVSTGVTAFDQSLGYPNARMGGDAANSQARIVLDGGTSNDVFQFLAYFGQIQIYNVNDIIMGSNLNAVGRTGWYANPLSNAAMYVKARNDGDAIYASRWNSATHTGYHFRCENNSGTVLGGFRVDGSWHPPSLADSAAASSSVYYSTTAGKLVYKDSGGTVINLH